MATPPEDPRDLVIVALDFPSSDPARRLLDALGDDVRRVKIGLQLFVAEGPGFVREITARGLRIFLDLKIHDIPHTAARAIAAVRQWGVEMTTLHLSGGRAMLRAAVGEAGPVFPLGVSVLTSLDAAALRETGVEGPPSRQVLRLARLGWDSGIRGFVASAWEAGLLRREFDAARIVCPGIRPAGCPAGDQQRIATPAEALRRGATELVIGRPITASLDPRSAFLAAVEDAARAVASV